MKNGRMYYRRMKFSLGGMSSVFITLGTFLLVITVISLIQVGVGWSTNELQARTVSGLAGANAIDGAVVLAIGLVLSLLWTRWRRTYLNQVQRDRIQSIPDPRVRTLLAAVEKRGEELGISEDKIAELALIFEQSPEISVLLKDY